MALPDLSYGYFVQTWRVSMDRRAMLEFSLAATADKMTIQGQPGSSGAEPASERPVLVPRTGADSTAGPSNTEAAEAYLIVKVTEAQKFGIMQLYVHPIKTLVRFKRHAIHCLCP
ncbi:hypothetical protein SCLCIDRAFT_1091725 [Scleroderma citrinum Foug A]|uniref:Uncharacterized protein n=1 Tax=Scleroderma citrinum Foug A TaxID=1036808 RepID=A0A0C3DCR6_9AGAM|nr:hypothetical protein SCLCIDRAFT_1091725 [Scleroderma citrinum Foug A]